MVVGGIEVSALVTVEDCPMRYSVYTTAAGPKAEIELGQDRISVHGLNLLLSRAGLVKLIAVSGEALLAMGKR